MKLYIGGAWQGQDELARAENPGADIEYDFHMTVRGRLEAGEDIRAFAGDSEQFDDITMLGFAYFGSDAEGAAALQ